MPLDEWIKLWTYMISACLVISPSPAWTARPRFDTSTDMGLVLVPADAEVDSVIFRLRATDQDADFPLLFDITATVTPIVRIENLPCTLYNKICQANVILTKRLVPGRLHDFAVRVKDSKGDSNSMQATISVTNATTQRDKIFPHIPAIIMVPEDSKPGKELDYILVRSNQWSGKPVYIELWQPKELFTIRQRQTPAETRGVITLIGELDFETQSMYTLKMYATDPYTEPKKDTRNIAGLHLVVIVQDVQDVPPIFTLAPPLTKIDNTVQPGDVILRVHAEDGDKGVPREVTYGLVSEGNPFTPFFNISETTGEITLARPLEELTLITHVGAPVVLSIVAEEIRRSTNEPPAQATVVEVGLLLGEPGNSPPFFENDNYVAWIDENAEPGSVINFTEHYLTKVRDEDIGKAGVFALKLYNNNGTFEISPAVAERVANFIITVRDNALIDYETHRSLRFEIIAQEVGPATNLSATVPCTIFVRDVNDNAPEFDSSTYEVTLSENVPAGTRVVQVHATDKDTGSFGRIQYTRIIGPGNEAFEIDPNTGIITVHLGNTALDREITATLQLSVEARDEDGKGLRGVVPLIVHLLDVNDNPPIFEKDSYEFTLNENMTNFTMPAVIKAFDGDAEPPNNEIRYELVHGNYDNKFYLDEITGELFLREPINKVRRTRHNPYENFAAKVRNGFARVEKTLENMIPLLEAEPEVSFSSENSTTRNSTGMENVAAATKANDIGSNEHSNVRKKRENDDILSTLTARAYDLGVPHLSGTTQVKVMKGPVAGARTVSFVVPGENPDPVKTAETLAAITGGRVTVQEIRPYTMKDVPNGSGTNAPSSDGEKKSIVVAKVEPNRGGTSLVDIERIRAALAANGVGVIGGGMPGMETGSETKSSGGYSTSHNTNTNTNITSVYSEEVTVYRAENRLLFWLLIILGLLMLLALIALIICCICPGCPFYMAPRKRRVHSSETLIARSDGRPRRHFQRSWPERKHAWSADPVRRNWQFNRRNQKAGGLASLPGDVHVIEREREIIEKPTTVNLREGGPVTMYSMTEQTRRPDEERIYIEDVEGAKARGYPDDSFRRQNLNSSLEVPQQIYVTHDDQPANDQSRFGREQHFYRDGNAEILCLVTRGEMAEEPAGRTSTKRPQTLVIEQTPLEAYRNDGKEILLQRFIEDQKNRQAISGQDLHDSFQDIERRSMESHQRQKDMIHTQVAQQQQQPTIVLLPERLEEDHRRHIEELGPEVQRLIIDHGNVDGQFEAKDGRGFVQGLSLTVNAPTTKLSMEKSKEQTAATQSVDPQHLTIRDFELARQNALLTRLLLERDGREAGGGALVDSASYLETQSLPGQVAIATQTDRTAATQTELPNRSRSDNEESEEDARIRKKLKSKKRYTDGEPRRIRTLWMRAPIEEEEMQYGSEKRTIFLRKKTRDVREPRRISLEPEVLREISDSLDENADPPVTARRKEKQEVTDDKDESPSDWDNRKLQESTSIKIAPGHGRKTIGEKKEASNTADDESQKKSHRGKRENVIEPSFRILEKEMSSLSKKLSKLAGKRILQYSNGSETDSRETLKTKTSTSGKKTGKKADIAETKIVGKAADAKKTNRAKSTSRTIASDVPLVKEQVETHRGVVDDKAGQKATVDNRKDANISTASSDIEETMEKLKKSVPPIPHAKKQSRTIVKQPRVKSKKLGTLDDKDPAKSTLSRPLDAGEGRDTSDTASKGSIKPWKSERDSMKAKRYDTGMAEGPSGLASGSTSSDSLKDRKYHKKDRYTMGRMSALETSEGITELEYHSLNPSSENSNDRKPPMKEKPKLLKKRAVNLSDGKMEPEETSDGPGTADLKGKADQQEEKPVVDEKYATEVRARKSPPEPTTDNLENKTQQDEEKMMLDRSPVGSGERKGDSEQAREYLDSENRKSLPRQRNEKPTLDRKSAVERIDERTESELNFEDANLANDKTSEGREKIPPAAKSPVESSETKRGAEPEATTVIEHADIKDDKTPQKRESPTLDVTSDVQRTGGKMEPESISGEHSEKLQKEQFQGKEIIILDTASGVEPEKRETRYEPASVLNSQDSRDKILQRDEKVVVETDVSAKVGEASGEVTHDKILRESLAKLDEEIPVGVTEAEFEIKSPQAGPSVVPVTAQMLKSEATEEERLEGKATASKTLGDSKPETSDEIVNELLTIPKEAILDFLNHEVKDSIQALQGHYHSMSDGAEKMKDLVVESVTMKNLDEKSTPIPETEVIPEGIELESHDDSRKLPKVPQDTTTAEQKIDAASKVDQDAEEEGAFSDNFDSFCELNERVKDSSRSRPPDHEIPYQTLKSQSSDEMPVDDKTHARDEVKGDEGVSSPNEPGEKSAKDVGTTETPESQKSTSISPIPSQPQITDSSPSPSRPTTVSRGEIPTSRESETPATETDTALDSLANEPEPISQESTLMEKPIDALRQTVKPEISSVKEELGSGSAEAPLDSQYLDEKMKTTDGSSGPPMMSPKSPSQSPARIVLEALPREFGIADSLFVDAKVLEARPGPKEVVAETKADIPEALKNEAVKVYVPPIDLGELSRTMLEDEADSDSSEASRKTMLTARPYGTPRHRSVSESGDAELDKESSEPIRTTSETREGPELVADTRKIGNETSPDERTGKILTKEEPGIEADALRKVVEGTTGEKAEPIVEVSAVTVPSETLKMEPETFTKSHDERVEIDVQEDARDEPTEKVQLYQIPQKPLLADPDGFASLPETSVPVKSFDGTQSPVGIPSSGETTKLSGEITKENVEKLDLETSSTDGNDLVSLPPADDTEERLRNSTRPEKAPLAKEAKKFSAKTSVKRDDGEEVEGPAREKIVYHPKKAIRGTVRKRVSSNGNLAKDARKTMTLSTTIVSPEKEQKAKTLKDQSTKSTNQIAAVGYAQDFQDPEGPADLQAAKQPTRSERVKRKKKKTEYTGKDVAEKPAPKVERVRKTSKDLDKPAGKQPMEASAKRKRIKASRAKQIQAAATKIETPSIIASNKVEKVLGAENIDRRKTGKDMHRERDESAIDESIQPAIKIIEMISFGESDRSMAPSLIASSEMPENHERKDGERKEQPGETPMVSSEKKKISPDAKTLETQSSEIRTMTTDASQDLPADTKKKESTRINETIETTMISEPSTESKTPAASEMRATQTMTQLGSTHRVEAEEASDQLEPKSTAKGETSGGGTSIPTEETTLQTAGPSEKAPSSRKTGKIRKETETVAIESQSRYMEWYKLKREEMERKRRDRKEGDEEEARPKWLRKSTRQRWIKVGPEDRRIFDPKITETTPSRRRKIKPLVNVESEQLRAIVRQGRKLRRAQGELDDEPQIQIFAPEKPPPPLCSISTGSRCHHHHHLVQHSEYKYEKMPLSSFYLHPQSKINTASQTSTRNYDDLCSEQKYSGLPGDSRCPNEAYDSAIGHESQQSGSKLRHGELLEKKSVFDIAYSEAAPSQLRSDSTTPPS